MKRRHREGWWALLALLGILSVSAGTAVSSLEQTHSPQQITEGFERGITLLEGSDVPWIRGGDSLWKATYNEHRGGERSAHSVHDRAGQVSWLQVTMDIQNNSTIKFWYKISSGSGALRFSIDCQKVEEWGPTSGWQQASIPVTSGTHTFQWLHSSSVEGHEAWIDDVEFPLAKFWLGEEHPAVLEKIKGDVEVKPLDSKWIPATDGMTIQSGTKVTTGIKASAVLKWTMPVFVCTPDGSLAPAACQELRVNVGELTIMTVHGIWRNRVGINATIDITLGDLDVKIAKKLKIMSNLKVRTHSATASVSGTWFRVSVGDYGLRTTWAVVDGAMTITDSHGNFLCELIGPAPEDWDRYEADTVPVMRCVEDSQGRVTVERAEEPRELWAVDEGAGEVPTWMVPIPAGSFLMGDHFGDRYRGLYTPVPVHSVYVSAFYMDAHEVTKAMWDEVAAWAQDQGYDIGPEDGAGKGPDHPVVGVSWYEAVKWCNARSEKEGRTPAYYTSADKTTVYRTGELDIQNDWVRWDTGYRLPTEAEWERAARGGCDGRRFPWCDSDTIDHSRANYYSDPLGEMSYDTSPTPRYHPAYQIGDKPYTSPVCNFPPNGFGLYDMAGNVWEWCWDWYSQLYYGESPGADPRGPSSGYFRVMRGGSFGSYAACCTVAHRDTISVYSDGRSNIGFRVVLPSGR